MEDSVPHMRPIKDAFTVLFDSRFFERKVLAADTSHVIATTILCD